MSNGFSGAVYNAVLDSDLGAQRKAGVEIPSRISQAMMRAGRKAFARERGNLSDLYECFAEDRDQFITAIYRSMAEAA